MVNALDLDLTGTEDSLITTEIDVSGFEGFRMTAIRCHRSQLEPATQKQGRDSEALRERYRRVNYFQLVASRVSPPAGLERDLFVGLWSE
jgi:LmbE family N-acetylglucosaminyl deacetylase